MAGLETRPSTFRSGSGTGTVASPFIPHVGSCAVLLPPPAFVPVANSFTIAFIPDAHVQVSNHTEWTNLCAWIVANASAYNIVAVVGEGDIIDQGADGVNGPTQFTFARTAWDSFVTAGIPTIAGVGNHDYDADVRPSTRALTRFDTAFPLSWMSGQSWYGGAQGTSAANSYIKFTVGTRKFIIIVVDIYPSATTTTWALGIANANPTYDVILMSHSHLNPDGTRTASTDLYGSANTDGAGATGPGDAQDANAVWNAMKAAANLKFIVCGHQLRTPEPSIKTAYRHDFATPGQVVHQWFANYQTLNGGNSMIGLLRQYTNSNQVDLCAYSTATGFPDPQTILRLTW